MVTVTNIKIKIMETLPEIPANYLKDRKYTRKSCVIKYCKMNYLDLITNSLLFLLQFLML